MNNHIKAVIVDDDTILIDGRQLPDRMRSATHSPQPCGMIRSSSW
jgi:hypothetical protein